MPLTLSDADLNELNRLMQRFRLDAMPEVEAIGTFINARIAEQKAAEAPKVPAPPPAAPQVPLPPAGNGHDMAQPPA